MLDIASNSLLLRQDAVTKLEFPIINMASVRREFVHAGPVCSQLEVSVLMIGDCDDP